MRKLAIFCFAAMLAPLAGARAQSPDRILSEAVAALGGDKALKAVPGVTWVGEAGDDSGATWSFTLVASAPDHIYLEWSGLDGWSEGYNGNSAWRRDSAGIRTLTGAESDQLKATALLWNSRLVDYKKDKWTATALAPGAIAGHAADVVELSNQAGAAAGVKRKLYFDPRTHLWLADEQEGVSPPLSVQFDLYQPVHGVQMPHRLVWNEGGHQYEIHLTELAAALPANPRVFDFPGPKLDQPPDMGQLLGDLIRHQNALDRLRRQYSCTLDQTEESIDGHGKLTRSSTDEFYVFYLGNHEFQKHVASNGQPLSPREQQKEDARIDKEQAEYARKAAAHQPASSPPAGQSQNPPQNQTRPIDAAADAAGAQPPPRQTDGASVHVRDFLAAMDFYNFRRETYRGQEVLVLDFRPKPNFKPRDIGESIATHLVGTVWIDESEHQVARLQARNNGAIKFGGGLLASIASGSSVVVEQEKINGEVWLPVFEELHLNAHVLLLKSENVNEIDRYTDYKKFTASTTFHLIPGGG